MINKDYGLGPEPDFNYLILPLKSFIHLGTDSLDPAKGFNIVTNKIRPNKIRERKDGKVWICTRPGNLSS